jgi:2-polyprenyl-3-methyl-5-hydroxy-6-metoxy-1,4-benzoquinol methylase
MDGGGEKDLLGKDYDRDMYDSYFALQNSPIFQQMLQFTIESNLPELAGKTAYDNGFGAGFSLNILLNRQLQSYTGLDLSDAMVPYLTQHAEATDASTNVVFIKGDNTEDFSKNGCNPVDFVISSYAMYVNCADKLAGFTKHLFDAVRDDGLVFLMVIHPDYRHTKEVLDDLARFGNFLEPVLEEGHSYEEFSPYKILCKPPYFQNEIEFEEFVVSAATLQSSLREAGFSNITSVDILTAPGYEELLQFARAFNLAIYKCSK